MYTRCEQKLLLFSKKIFNSIKFFNSEQKRLLFTHTFAVFVKNSLFLICSIYFYICVLSKYTPYNKPYPKIAFKSASGVVIGCNWNFSTKIFNTLLEKNFGKDGPI